MNEKEFCERVDAFDWDLFIQGNSVEKVTDDIECPRDGDIDVEVFTQQLFEAVLYVSIVEHNTLLSMK